MATCRLCTAPIIWATMAPNGGSIPLDDHEQLDYDPPRPAEPADLGPARWRIVREGSRPVVEAVTPDSRVRTYVDHRYLCQQPRAI